MRNALCWWFGCKPVEEAIGQSSAIPCDRCGAHDIDYSDLVGDTRHRRFMDGLTYPFRWLRWQLFPEKCWDCGKRYGDHRDCLPF